MTKIVEDDAIVLNVATAQPPRMYSLTSVAVDKRYGVHVRTHYVVLGQPWGGLPFCMSCYTFTCVHTEAVKEHLQPTTAKQTVGEVDLSEDDDDNLDE